jgi:hypothetical protein
MQLVLRGEQSPPAAVRRASRRTGGRAEAPIGWNILSVRVSREARLTTPGAGVVPISNCMDSAKQGVNERRVYKGFASTELRLHFSIFHHSPFAGANDEKSGFVGIVTQDCGGCAALSWAIIGRPSGALFWRWAKVWISQRAIDRRLLVAIFVIGPISLVAGQ